MTQQKSGLIPPGQYTCRRSGITTNGKTEIWTITEGEYKDRSVFIPVVAEVRQVDITQVALGDDAVANRGKVL